MSALDSLIPEEQETTMRMMSSFRREGIQEGLHQGKETLVARQIRRCFDSVTPDTLARLNPLSADQLDELGVALFDFNSLADLENWLERRLKGE